MRQKFDQEFRERAVQLALEKRISQKQLADDLGIGLSTLNKWLHHYKRGFPVSSGLTPDQKVIKRLEHENAILKEERDILKKTMAIFSSPHRKNLPS